MQARVGGGDGGHGLCPGFAFAHQPGNLGLVGFDGITGHDGGDLVFDRLGRFGGQALESGRPLVLFGFEETLVGFAGSDAIVDGLARCLGVGPGVEEELDDGPVVAVADPRAVLPSLATASIVAATAGRVSR